ncbi:MAG TPA: cysteine--tRNA ligase [Armatimonadota bacterium]
MLRVYNSLTREKEEFVPLRPGRVNMYVCGPTVYDSPHIGHAKAYVSFDVIVRTLRHRGLDVFYVQNITDVGHLTDNSDEGEDKILARAERDRVEPMELVEKYTFEFFDTMDRLNVLRPNISPRASGHIPEIIELCQELIKSGHAYESNGSVYFSVESFPDYGKLSNRRAEDQEAGSRVAVIEGKRNPADFAIWKLADKGHILRWNSPWGEGFPGWHIECSAMSMKYLGQTLDIHGGGRDNIFPHHEDEIAQSEAATGHPFVKYWMHNGMVTLNGQKMSKSTGNFVTVRQALEQYPAQLLRFYIVSSHYRSSLDFSEDLLEDSRRGWTRIQNALQAIDRVLVSEGPEEEAASEDARRIAAQAEAKFEASLDDDFNTPNAVAALFELAGDTNRLVAGAGSRGRAGLAAAKETMVRLSDVLGLTWESETRQADDLLPGLMNLLLGIRQKAREDRDWALADHLRDQLTELGIVLEDRVEGGTSWRRK